MTQKPMFYLLDGHAVAYRQYFGLPAKNFSTSIGEPTNATFGFTRILLDLIEKVQPDYLAVSFDRGLSGRDVLYDAYKGTRDKMPDDLAVQMMRIDQVVRAFNIPVLAVDGYEADDVIGTVIQQAEHVHFRIVTGDRDLLQLLDEHVTVALPSKIGPDDVYDVAAFEAKYGVRPDQLVDMKALMGDSSDNIPGVAGIGEKTAVKLLQAYGTLDGIYESLDEIKGANRKKLEAGRDLAYISRDLARIKRDVPIQLDLSRCVAHEFDRDMVAALFRELEFRGFMDRLLGSTAGQPEQLGMFEDVAPPPRDVEHLVETQIVADEAALDTLIDTLSGAERIAWDVETTSTDQMTAELVGIALSVDEQRGYYVPVGHQTGQQLALETVIDALRGPLTNPNIIKVAHNAPYDAVVMARYGIDVTPIGFDTMVAEWLREPTSKFLGLKNFAAQYLGVRMMPITDLIGSGKKQKTMREVYIEEAAPYAAADVVMTLRAQTLLHAQLAQAGLLSLYETLELPLIPVIAAMQQAGVLLDNAFLKAMSGRLTERLTHLEQEIFALSGGYGAFNINSPKQLNDVLFGKLGLPVEGLKKTSHGYSTNAATLEQLKYEHEIVRLILSYRELTKLQGTYVDALPMLVNPRTGRLHTSYNQTGTTTGRLSSNNPNLQNIPIRTELGREVRRAFVAPEGRVLLAVDYSQIELRVLAHISQDETLLRAFAHDQDIHRATAAAVYDIELDEVTYEQRSFAKRVNFGLIYGMGAFRLARDSDLTLAEANAFINTYFERMPNVQTYIEQTRQQAIQTGTVQTLFGRKRHFPRLQRQGGNRNDTEADLRAAVNMPIQGTAADIMKRAMIDLYAVLRRDFPDVLMTLQVHDELVLEVPQAQLETVRDLVVSVMESAYKLDAPLKANAQFGTNWRDMTSF